MSGVDVGELWETAGESWAHLGPLGGRATHWVGRAQMGLPRAYLPLDNW